MIGVNKMPKLDGKEYGYDKEGYKKYLTALKKKRKRKPVKVYGDQNTDA